MLNHTSLCEYQMGKLLLHIAIPFEVKPTNARPGDQLRYYRLQNRLTTRQLAEKVDVVPSTILAYEENRHPIPYDMAIQLAEILNIEQTLLFDEFFVFLATPYQKALKIARNSLDMNSREFAEYIGITPSYYYKLEEGIRRPSRQVYERICRALQSNNRQTSIFR